MPGGDAFILVGREELISKVLGYVSHRRSLFIKACAGSGKTALLTHLELIMYRAAYALPHSKKEILSCIAKPLKVPVKGRRVFELYRDVIFELEYSSCILLLDDVHELTKSVKAVVVKLLSHGLVVICAGERNVLGLPETNMPSLSREDVVLIINSRLERPDPLLAKLIINECSTPQEVNLVLRRVKRYDLSSRDKIHSFIDSMRRRKRELMPVWSLAIIISLMLSMRYFFYMKREFQTGYVIAFTAYLLRALTSFRKR